MAKKKLSPKQLEDLYDSGDNRLSQERNDFLLPQILDFVNERKWLNIRPEYQRRLVWDEKKKSRFIESLLMNIPIPPIFLYETDLNRYEVMDGQQRLNTIIEFYSNTLRLRGLETWDALNGYTYDRCPPRIKRGLDRRRISATVLLAENVDRQRKKDGDSIRREVFERLNTGGESLNAQELRNSLYSGSFNDMIIDLAGNTLFDEIWGIPPYATNYIREDNFISPELAQNEYFKRMRDCEIVLRFFALRQSDNIKGSLQKMLDNCMGANREISHEQIEELKTLFVECLQVAHALFGEHTFMVRKLKDGQLMPKWDRSIPMFDAVMVAVEKLLSDKSKLIVAKKGIKAALVEALKRDNVYEVLVGKPNTAKAVKQRLDLIYKLMKRSM